VVSGTSQRRHPFLLSIFVSRKCRRIPGKKKKKEERLTTSVIAVKPMLEVETRVETTFSFLLFSCGLDLTMLDREEERGVVLHRRLASRLSSA